jgi:hypothetical protein
MGAARQERDENIRQLMTDLFAKARSKDVTLPSRIKEDLRILFSTPVRGFREILLVITIASILDKEYRATKDFYACNPRAIYEGPIRQELAKRHIPHGKSGPLNVAKATKSINEQWAAQREPKAAAEAVVRLTKLIEGSSAANLEQIAIGLHRRFLDEAKRVEKLTFEPKSALTVPELVSLLSEMIIAVPDLGNTPQRICGELLKALHHLHRSPIEILGIEDRACTTSTTSKKPGDVVEIDPKTKAAIRVFEISVKRIDDGRLDDCVDAAQDYGSETGAPVGEIFFLCRKRDVCVSGQFKFENAYFGAVVHRGILFHFIDIFKWIEQAVACLPDDFRKGLLDSIADYVNDPNTSDAVKIFWNAYWKRFEKDI